MNVELTKKEWSMLRPFVKVLQNIGELKYEVSECGHGCVYLEIYDNTEFAVMGINHQLDWIKGVLA